MYLNSIFPITDLPRGLGLNFFSLVCNEKECPMTVLLEIVSHFHIFYYLAVQGYFSSNQKPCEIYCARKNLRLLPLVP